jgi:hypothetical protein
MFLGFYDGPIHITGAMRTELTGVYAAYGMKQINVSGEYATKSPMRAHLSIQSK